MSTSDVCEAVECRLPGSATLLPRRLIGDDADEAGWLAKRRLADEDGGRSRRVGPKQRTRLKKALAVPFGHDLDGRH